MKTPITFLCLLLSLSSLSQLSDKWSGHFVGDLFARNLAGAETTYHMKLEISKKTDSSYQWLIIYGKDSLRQERDYELNLISENLYEMDEKNGLILHVSFNDNALTSVFEVQDNLLHVIYRLSKKGILFELTSSNSKRQTGGSDMGSGEAVPEAISYKTVAFQTAFLKRQ